MNYKQAFDKITEAYIRGEIEPYNREFCFCGTIGHTQREIGDFLVGTWDYTKYSGEEYFKMEYALLTIIRDSTIDDFKHDIYVQDEVARTIIRNHPNYETALFAGMSAALDVLKQIHIERGEVIDEVPEFVKRALTSTPLK